MKATNWEFTNRAMIFGMIIGVSFGLYSVDHENVTSKLADWAGPRLQIDADLLTRLLFYAAALLLVLAALLRTWASAYLQAAVVYASQVKTQTLVADGPYRYLRNPLYFANLLLAIGMGSIASRSGCVLMFAGMWLFCYRLILREEGELQSSQTVSYDAYKRAVPRLWPSARPRVASSGRPAKWADGFNAECWYWGFALGMGSFAATLSLKIFFAAVGAAIGLLWISSSLRRRAGITMS